RSSYRTAGTTRRVRSSTAVSAQGLLSWGGPYPINTPSPSGQLLVPFQLDGTKEPLHNPVRGAGFRACAADIPQPHRARGGPQAGMDGGLIQVDVEPGRAEPAFLQSDGQGLFPYQVAARRIDQDRARLHEA